MRAAVHDVPVSFRASAAIIAAAETKARRQGMSLSEFMRAAIRREVKDAA